MIHSVVLLFCHRTYILCCWISSLWDSYFPIENRLPPKLSEVQLHLPSYLFVIVLFWVIPISSVAQETDALPQVSNKQLLADFDYFVGTIKDFNPQIAVRKAVTGIDILEELDEIREKVKDVASTKAFTKLMLEATTVLQDGHSSFLWPAAYDSAYLKEVGVSDEAISYFPNYYAIWKSINADKKFNLKLAYINGEYFNILPFEHQDKKYKAGWKLTEINGKAASSFIGGLYPHLRGMRWDYSNKRYYATNFYKALNISSAQVLDLTFEAKNGRKIKGAFDLRNELNYKNESEQQQQKNVEYFEKEQLLYVRIPRMNLDHIDYYPEEIQEKASDKPLKKVVIDIRGNRGGADNVWVKVLTAIIKNPIEYEMLLLAKPSEPMKNSYPKDSPNWKTYYASFLDSLEYAVFASGERKLEPSEKSLRYDGQIYLLVDEKVYSSAGALMAIGLLADNIIVVGQNTGKLLGRGINPLVFELPNSKILYRLEPVIDFQNVASARDVYHDEVEIPVNLTIKEYLRRLNYEGNIYGKKFLFKHDPVFRKVLKLK